MKRMIIVLLFCLFLVPKFGYSLELIPNAKSGILIEINSGKIIYEKNKDLRVSIASLTKMVAQIVIFEEIEKGKISLDDIVTVSHNASSFGGSQIYLEEGEKMSVRDLIKGISVASGNDATVAMAEYISGSEEKFVVRMNDVAKRLKLKNTHFVNCTGLDEDNHYSSSYDLAIIARELVLKHPKILEFSSIYEDYLRKDTANPFWLVNTNKLINFYEGADGLKTGHTDNAGYCLASTAKRNNLRLIGIVLGEKDSKIRNREMMDLLDYGFQSIKINCIYKKGKIVDNVKIELTGENVPIALKNDLCVIEEKDDIKYKYLINKNKIKLPIKAGDVVGNIEVLSKNEIIAREDLTVLDDINKMKLIEFLKYSLLNFILGVF